MAGYVEMYRLGKTYDTPKGPAVIVEDFNLNMTKGEYVCLLGHSGCGKSTVLSMVAGLNPITEGGVVVAKREIDGPWSRSRRCVSVAVPDAMDDRV